MRELCEGTPYCSIKPSRDQSLVILIGDDENVPVEAGQVQL
jgi:hypothetical protein